MKKLTSLVCATALGLFAIGCNEPVTDATVDPDGVPTPEAPGEIEGGSVEGGSVLSDDAALPPATDDVPPALPAPEEPAAAPEAEAEADAEEAPME